ncbi:hypothetical protein D1641_09350 [Colidextribacter sp. OB.20]|uniref:hypothetical protein n=1 Tax=Colidextribacter sp. OB.20 TaxID=2304568 RepID=UPI00136DF2B0|nr:hypothetical protein [Colidextribacter sp. OB.20]NBI10215.1 hypothetical protein [Colidextribacter sp. OB.20]
MTYWMTQSLLSAWIYYLGAEEEHAATAWDSFLSTLRREKKDPTKAMQDGTLFEDMVNRIVSGAGFDETVNEKWIQAAIRVAKRCDGGLSQVPITGSLSVDGMDFCLYGVCDYIKAGVIMDIKKVVRYEYGKYQNSPQHPLYLHLLPEAKRFDYLIFDGSNCYVETYRRGDFRPIAQTIAEFIRFLTDAGGLDIYKAFWSMDNERERKRRAAQ